MGLLCLFNLPVKIKYHTDHFSGLLDKNTPKRMPFFPILTFKSIWSVFCLLCQGTLCTKHAYNHPETRPNSVKKTNSILKEFSPSQRSLTVVAKQLEDAAFMKDYLCLTHRRISPGASLLSTQ